MTRDIFAELKKSKAKKKASAHAAVLEHGAEAFFLFTCIWRELESDKVAFVMVANRTFFRYLGSINDIAAV